MKKVAFVALGAVGTGRKITLALAETGYDVVVHHHRTPAPAGTTARRVGELGRRALVVEGDLDREEQVREMIRRAAAWYGRLDVVVDCLAGPAPTAPAPESPAYADPGLLDRLRSPWLLTRTAAPLLARSGGTVVHVAELDPVEARWPSALAHLTRELARVLAPKVRVNAVAAGPLLEVGSEATPDAMADREGRSDDVVRTVLFLLGSHHLTGELVRADSGHLP